MLSGAPALWVAQKRVNRRPLRGLQCQSAMGLTAGGVHKNSFRVKGWGASGLPVGKTGDSANLLGAVHLILSDTLKRSCRTAQEAGSWRRRSLPDGNTLRGVFRMPIASDCLAWAAKMPIF